MKKLSLFVSAFALFASTSYADINCATLPTCESLGYTDAVDTCPRNEFWEQYRVIKCPFDLTKGKCIHPAAIGQVAAFPSHPGSGWLPCNGAVYKKSQYPELSKILDKMVKSDGKNGNPFCDNSLYHGSCSADEFAVPDYRGYFLRANMYYNEAEKSNAKKLPSQMIVFDKVKALFQPLAEELPDIRGTFAVDDTQISTVGNFITGAFEATTVHAPFDLKSSSSGEGRQLNFKASKDNSIYKFGRHVLPYHYTVNYFIYAGRD